MADYNFYKNNAGALCRYRNGIFDGFATNPEVQLFLQLDEAREALYTISPWLAASLTDQDCCKEYKEACEKCFEADRITKVLYSEK